MNKKKICVITGTRAEYGLLYWLMKGIQADNTLELQLIATGMHLSPEFGLTYMEIKQDGFPLDYKVEMLLSSDTPSSISKSTGLGLIGFADAFNLLKPDGVIALGDRYEIFAACTAAFFARIPIVHIHGGETTAGAFDEALRHSITKMATLHFVAAEQYRKRVIQLGEHQDRVFNVGALGVENIKRMNLLQKEELEEILKFRFGEKTLLVTFHPVTLEQDSSCNQFNELLTCLDKLENTKIIFTKANADTDGRIINIMIDEYVNGNEKNSIAFTSMGQLNYLSSMKYVDAVVGNSSSGVLEAPSFKIGTINIGDRQKGRIIAKSIINCSPDRGSILKAIEKLYSADFSRDLKSLVNPIDGGIVSDKIIDKIKSIDCNQYIKKEFFDL
ncbi:MAG: UDP-N-acetylglucosamine 2-epimerase (hydrolyzing) [Bacteroidetes bacterium]|nr:UDP-N-acetylglucosamine 2-epimerase (hydrolyzing) [Bacteroidota bacterium]